MVQEVVGIGLYLFVTHRFIFIRYTNHLTLKMTSAQVVETSVNVISNSPSQDYTHPDDRTLLYDKLNMQYILGSQAGVVNINHAFHLYCKCCMWIEFQSIST